MSGEKSGGRVRVERVGDRTYRVLFEGEDHTMGNLLATTLTGMPEVEAASYMKPHPLEDKIVVFVSLRDSGVDVVDVLIKALERILEKNKVFRELYLAALRERGVSIEA
ncbi:MAG: RpoL/Rpb11 RNA polymerase subunit family protein [Acidilobaceae archaeon]